MRTSILFDTDIQPAPMPTRPRPVYGLSVAGLGCAALGTLFMVHAVDLLRDYADDSLPATIAAVLLVVATFLAWVPALRAFALGRKRAALLGRGDVVEARRTAARGRELALISMGYAASSLVVAGIGWFVFTNEGGVAGTFFSIEPIVASFGEVAKGFWTNVWVAVVAEVLVLVLGLVVALVRMLPGRAGAPLRFLAVLYADIFRGIPAIIVILLIGFGLPLTGVPVLKSIPLEWLGIFALTLTYTAYVSEVYRAGLTSIHPSQAAAARSLGLSYSQTLRTVLVPQAVRRVIPPLLNDFIGLQKDTALLFTIGVAETLANSKLYQGTYYNLSPILLSALLFVLITIPQARFVDHLLHRDASVRRGGSR
jgi:polar amino acid transport system permease protein